jgi:hypothetical protein
MDCLSLDSVRKFAVNWEARELPLNVLINIGSTSCMDGICPFFPVFIRVFDGNLRHVAYLAELLVCRSL